MGGIRNFQVCARCRNHGVCNILKGHKKTCEFKQCGCDKCLVTKDRQNFIAKEIAMHRYEDKNNSESSNFVNQGLKLNLVRSRSIEEKTLRSIEVWSSKRVSERNTNSGEIRRDQMCSRCRNHGISRLLRGHKNTCVYVNCICEKCKITKKRREIMAKQIKEYRSLKPSEFLISSPETLDSSEAIQDFNRLTEAQFVDYEPIESRDIFFMVQSLFEKYANHSSDKKIQLIYAFTHLANGNWKEIENSLEKGKNLAMRKLIRNLANLQPDSTYQKFSTSFYC